MAREAGTPKVAMIDCSVDDFNKLNSAQALKAIAKAAKLAAHRGYAHITDALKKTDSELVPVFDDLWTQEPQMPLAIIFDEVDYITPGSPTRDHWRHDFNPFWREFRVMYQEAQRRGGKLSVLVSGVSSYAFRVESFDEIENSVLHFVPEEYLSPFARDASKAMLRDLSKRCGLVFSDSDLDTLAEACGDFPYWMRMAGSYLHRAIEIQGRPITISSEVFSQLLYEFIEAEGADLAQVALDDLGRKSKDTIDLLRKAASVPSIPLRDGKLLSRYGLAKQKASNVTVNSAMIKKAIQLIPLEREKKFPDAKADDKIEKLNLETAEWAEELSVISRRRNLIERKLREFVHFGLKFNSKKGENWTDKVLKALPEKQRVELTSLSGDTLISKLYWRDIESIIAKYWEAFESTLGDKKRFSTCMDLLNDRPDTHAKPIDAADIALYRRELSWLEERLS